MSFKHATMRLGADGGQLKVCPNFMEDVMDNRNLTYFLKNLPEFFLFSQHFPEFPWFSKVVIFWGGGGGRLPPA